MSKSRVQHFNFAVLKQFALCIPLILVWRFLFLPTNNRAMFRLISMYFLLVPLIIFTIRYIFNTIVVLKKSVTGDCSNPTWQFVLQKRSSFEKTFSVVLASIAVCLFLISFFVLYKSSLKAEPIELKELLTQKLNTEILVGSPEDANTIYQDSIYREHVGKRANKPYSWAIANFYAFSEEQFITFQNTEKVSVDISLMYMEHYPKILSGYVHQLNCNEINESFDVTKSNGDWIQKSFPNKIEMTAYYSSKDGKLQNSLYNQSAILVETEDSCFLLIMNDLSQTIDFHEQNIEEYCLQIVQELQGNTMERQRTVLCPDD